MFDSNESFVYFNPNGAERFPNIAQVECLLGGVGTLCFEDGTEQFANNDDYPKIVFSPRMTEDELEIFCRDNMHHYEAYYEENKEALDNCYEVPPINPFWENNQNMSSANFFC